VLDGHGPDGALLIAAPPGFERQDATAGAWMTTQVIAEIESKSRMREHLRIAARQWQNRGRQNALLWRGEVLADFERWMRHATSGVLLDDLEAAFVCGEPSSWATHPVAPALGGHVCRHSHARGVVNHFATEARMAEQIATQAEVEQGRQALLPRRHRGGAATPCRSVPGAAITRQRSNSCLHARCSRAWPSRHALSPQPGGCGRPRSHQMAKRIVTADDKAAQVWDARTNQLRFTLPHGDTIYDARYSADGTRLVTTASGDGAVRIWDATTGALVRELKARRYADEPLRHGALA